MKVYIGNIDHEDSEKAVHIPVRWNSEVNLLIYLHGILFLTWLAADLTGILSEPFNEGTLADFVKWSVALPGPSRLSANWIGNLFTYQFVHFNLAEFVLSMSILWFFGHILASFIGERRVVMLYLITTIVAAVAFLFSHMIFPVFSGDTIMEGAFAGALAVMTAVVVFLRSYTLRLFQKFSLSFPMIYILILIVSVPVIFKSSMAYVFLYAASICSGVKYAWGTRMKKVA